MHIQKWQSCNIKFKKIIKIAGFHFLNLALDSSSIENLQIELLLSTHINPKLNSKKPAVYWKIIILFQMPDSWTHQTTESNSAWKLHM